MKLANKSLLGTALLFVFPMLGVAGTLQNLATTFGKDIKNSGVKIAVMDFSTSDFGALKNQDSFVIRERLTTYLVQSKKVILIERALLEKVFQEQKIQMSGVIGADTAKRLES